MNGRHRRVVATGAALSTLLGATMAWAQPKPRLAATDIDTIALHLPGTRVAYGPDSLQFGDLRIPAKGRGPFPVAIVVHGGCYLSSYASLRNTAALAEALTDAGIATWNIEYRRYDHPGGGWPGTFTDAARGTDYVRVLARSHPIDTTRVVTIGHSAGGQLALWLASRSQLTAGNPLYAAAPLRITGVVALGPLIDLREYQPRERRTCGNPAVEAVLGAMPDSVPDRVRLVSPIERVPLHVPTALVAGADDAIAPRAVLEAYATAARARGDSVTIVTTPGEGHFDAIAPARDAGKAAIEAVRRLLRLPPSR